MKKKKKARTLAEAIVKICDPENTPVQRTGAVMSLNPLLKAKGFKQLTDAEQGALSYSLSQLYYKDRPDALRKFFRETCNVRDEDMQ